MSEHKAKSQGRNLCGQCKHKQTRDSLKAELEKTSKEARKALSALESNSLNTKFQLFDETILNKTLRHQNLTIKIDEQTNETKETNEKVTKLKLEWTPEPNVEYVCVKIATSNRLIVTKVTLSTTQPANTVFISSNSFLARISFVKTC